jgi:MerR family transcriptional regulator, light-induced transcriptional regulator
VHCAKLFGPRNSPVTEAGGLTIGELSRRTGVPAATLRSWEARYGFPRPRRQVGGHRRYTGSDAALVREVMRRRSSGISLEAAVRQVTARSARPEPSVFAGLRRQYPELSPLVLRRPTLLALSQAIEDECCARAERPLLLASFQRERFYRRSAKRWRELARTAERVVVFADFAAASDAPGVPVLVPVPADAPMRREWTIVCDASDYPACLTGWEIPGQSGRERRFEVVWTTDPAIVRGAALICLDLAMEFAPALRGHLDGLLPEPPPSASPELTRATGLLTRMIAYLEAAASPSAGASDRAEGSQ